MRRLVGYDLNGWRDVAARNWLEQPGQEVAEGMEQIVSGGVGGVVVRLGETGCEGLMGGAQALRAPHGLGPGWGFVGAPARRLSVKDLLAAPSHHVPEIAAALRGLADPTGPGGRFPTTAVLAIPDSAAYEEEQEALLLALRAIRATGDSLLVWRPVLACLAALDRGTIDGVSRVGIIGHDRGGLTSQMLPMREDRGLWAPERREIGQLHIWGGGLDALRRRAWQALVDACETPQQTGHLATARILVPLALGDTPSPEPVRRFTGGWEIVSPELMTPQLPPIPQSLIDHLRGCEAILIDTPTAGAMRESLLDALSANLPCPVHPLDYGEVARGALLAAGRVARGEPVYFDFLPQLSTIVQDAEGARSFDLIPPDALLPAGRVYRSAQPARLGLMAGMDRIKVYLKKQQADACRLVEVPLAAPADRAAAVTLDVEQAPAAGRARLTLASDAFPAPLLVDWERAEVLEESWDELIENLRRPRPNLPNRVVLPCGLDTWQGQNGAEGLEELLMRSVAQDRYDWARLATLMAARVDGRYAISSDGLLPDGLSREAAQALDSATSAAEAHVVARLESRVRASNDSLRFLTWQFRRCPTSVIAPMLEALEAPIGGHVFVQLGGNRQLVYQGLGRVLREESTQRTVFDHLMSVPRAQWHRDHIACAAHVLSRTEKGPIFLARGEIDQLGEIVLRFNAEAVGGQYRSPFIYAPFLMVGLLRFRLVDPWALVVQQDPLADRLLISTEKVIADMEKRFSRDQRIGRYRQVLEDACEWLKGEGRNPDILLDLAMLSGS